MKRHFITIFTVLSVSTVYAQEGRVGINTTTPNATLDVTASPTDITRTDGFIAPQLTGNQLKAKDALYTTLQTGTIVYATSPSPDAGMISTKTINVTSAGYYYFDGNVWVKITDTKNYVDPWYNIDTNRPATLPTENIYHTGKVSIGKRATNALLSVFDDTEIQNTSLIHTEYVSLIDNTKKPWIDFIGNLGTGSLSTLSIGGDQAIVFSVDADPYSFSRNAMEFIPHTALGGLTPFGFKITDQGMFSFNSQYPTETVDIGTGTLRVRSLPLNGAVNAIYTTPLGGSSVPATTDINGLAKTQTFTGSRTVISDANGVLGYVDGLPVTKNASGIVVIDNLPVFSDNAAAVSVPVGGLYRTATGQLMVKY